MQGLYNWHLSEHRERRKKRKRQRQRGEERGRTVSKIALWPQPLWAASNVAADAMIMTFFTNHKEIGQKWADSKYVKRNQCNALHVHTVTYTHNKEQLVEVKMLIRLWWRESDLAFQEISHRKKQQPLHGITIKCHSAGSQLSGFFPHQGHYFVTFSLCKIAV